MTTRPSLFHALWDISDNDGLALAIQLNTVLCRHRRGEAIVALSLLLGTTLRQCEFPSHEELLRFVLDRVQTLAAADPDPAALTNA